MREKKLYTCEICNTDYADKEKARQCEKKHKLLEKAVIVGEYKPIGMLAGGEPYKIRVKFPGTDKIYRIQKIDLLEVEE
uniref:Monocytic leukemia zinc finger protein finger, acetyl transferase, DNA n=1 Tax=Siphoviridae sp. ctNU74 TaxID=2825471 RepID=A0A8S5NXB4_9CAUD|nr:MAG TPA: Monocytic leukemia zinc finger protein finger, acetyl transferase, DNA [Siphoviridae sp. ctNU74]DAH76820.1 MAG TPA: Monocytic leukemia zinc finger protein finger, acetyl transferase, DNA [Caudoviricetes sp.]